MSAAIAPTRPQSDTIDVAAVRRDFPILHQTINGKPLVYLDNAASSQRPRAVIDAISEYYEHDHANVHRGVHTLSQRATDAYEGAREDVRRFINARETAEIVFVRGTTEAINLVAESYVRANARAGDEILITEMEHHSNIVPWQLLRESTGVNLVVAPVNDRGELIMEEFEKRLSDRTKLVSVVHVSNALGTINPVKEIVDLAHARGARVLLDGAQAVPHIPVDVQDLDCDFYALSGHKVYGPTGIGILYGKADVLEEMRPYQGGGEMILSVTFEKTTYNELPYKFEAGTPDIAGAIGLGAAVDYLTALDRSAVARYEHELLEYAEGALLSIPGLEIVGTAREKAGLHSFTMEGIHPHDIGTILDHEGIAVRTGHHCAQPVMDKLADGATARASLGIYNTREDIDRLIEGLHRVRSVLG